jgi:hypothetical protein
MQQQEHIPLDIEPNTKQESMLVYMLIHSRTRYDGVLGNTCMTGYEEDTTAVVNFYAYNRGEVTDDRADLRNRKGVHLGDSFISADLPCPFGRLDFQEVVQRRGMQNYHWERNVLMALAIIVSPSSLTEWIQC